MVYFMSSSILIRGAREHNLKNLTVEIPRDQLVVITGLSGSGKSSLAFDTLYAEGQRRYVESLSSYARQFLQLMQKPDVDGIDGLSPAISIEQKTTSKNPRSTVGTVTEIYDYLRLLFARIGVPHSPATGLPIQSQTVSEMVDRILILPQGTRLYLLAPIVRGRKGEYKKEILDLRKKGFQRIRIDGNLYDIEDAPELNKKLKHDIEIVVDRLVVGPDLGNRLAEAIETALNLSGGLLYALNSETQEDIVFSSKFACPVSGFTIEEIEPRLFSFNSPFGACPACDGLGMKVSFDPDLIIPDETLSLEGGAVAPWANSFAFYYNQALEAVCQKYGGKMTIPFHKLPEKTKEVILYGSGKDLVPTRIEDGTRSYQNNKSFEGVIPTLERRWRESKEKEGFHDEQSKYQSTQPCEVCCGYRLKPEALAVKISGKSIGEVTELSIADAENWFQNLPQHLSQKEIDIAHRILKEIQERLGFLVSVGLGYLSLSRSSGTLSGGESQRIRLASQIGSGLMGVLYVLDEPSIGLHQRDNDRLLATLKRLRDLGNSVVVVEHDEDAIRMADYVIDMGPGAGAHGGEIVAKGTPQEIIDNPKSLTGQYLCHTRGIPLPEKRRKLDSKKVIQIKKATANNLKSIDVDFPLGGFVAVTGVSGGGKSSLVLETLFKGLCHEIHGHHLNPKPYESLKGLDLIDKVIDIDQSPIGRTPRSNPATYTGIFTPIREWFASLPESKARGYGPGRFSFNVKGGRCEACQGDGVIKIEMHFLPDVYVECDKCHGKRYNRETLDIRYRDKSISDILDMTVDEAINFFHFMPSLRDKLATLAKVGLGYIHVGQRATTLSGGEAQRIKLSKELGKRATGKTLYILDEPTTGLHFEDVRKLLEVLHALVDQGNSVIVIEHNLEVIKTADWIIDLGPEGGDGGGEIVAFGTPENVVKVEKSYTGLYLKPYLKG
ncbi:Excinuclease ABC subunit UvrA [Candidatus Bealeia paramacronuclearis]|uniref:UvrABC system protein A n=2 Tax=Candidatus Bealeia paramacronuclearis TaxID=1921001 RepID=A0ABZ2C374_9PROT|nr:Excinuclease ABC subunit UvrA [Candidatus Bealeia paramacronuclearis]